VPTRANDLADGVETNGRDGRAAGTRTGTSCTGLEIIGTEALHRRGQSLAAQRTADYRPQLTPRDIQHDHRL